MGQIYLMTDKEDTKDCPCTHAMCDNIVRVNKFYAPSKAKCPDHGGEAYVKNPVDEGDPEDLMKFQKVAPVVVESTPAVPTFDNHRLGQLHCPFCDDPMEILACTENGHISFACTECESVVDLWAGNWRGAQVRSVPKRLQPLVQAFNLKQVGDMDVALAMHFKSSV